MELLHGWRTTVNHDRPACQGPTIRGDVLSSAKAVSGDDPTARVSAAVPTAARVGSRAVKPCGTSSSRTAAAAIAAWERTARSSPAGHRKISPNPRLGARPRAVPRRPVQQRLALPLPVGGPALDSGDTARGGTPGLPPSSAKSGWHANAANGLPRPGTPHCNTASGHTRAGRTARSLSTGSDDDAAPDRSLAREKIDDHDEVDPRERQLPKGQVPERTSTPLRDALYSLPYPSASLPSRLIAAPPGRHSPPVRRHGPSPANRLAGRRNGSIPGRR
jgi:hypothetical protein